MNTVNFFGHEISKLIIGDNPMTGHSYIQNVITGQEMMDFYTAEKIKEAMFGYFQTSLLNIDGAGD